MVKTRVPYAKHLGDVRNITAKDVLNAFSDPTKPLLIIGGSPCNGTLLQQGANRNIHVADFFFCAYVADLSMLKGPDRKGLLGDKSVLFYEYVRLLDGLQRELGPDKVWFLFENVASMKGNVLHVLDTARMHLTHTYTTIVQQLTGRR